MYVAMTIMFSKASNNSETNAIEFLKNIEETVSSLKQLLNLLSLKQLLNLLSLKHHY